MPADQRLLTPLFWMLLGCFFIGGSAVVFSMIPVTEYTTTVEPATAEEVDQIDGHDHYYTFSTLSDRAQSLFLTAKNTTKVTTTNTSRLPPEFEYYDDTTWDTYVQHDGKYYLVWTYRSDCLGCPIAQLGGALIGLIGAGFVLLGLILRLLGRKA
ncbi:hypothetical protein [Haloarcula sebkhae]|uniref:Uncharacterized protein n=2 Tax=Haloarcula sebkhae TaxID=932660 RepID=A0ACC6VL92_9EURY|nr:hypothetical protein [Haloarcula sebkhae]